MSSNHQQQAVEALVAKFKQHYVACGFTPEDDREHSTLVPVQDADGSSLTSLTFGQVVDCLADAGLLCSSPDVQPQEDEGRSVPTPSAPRVFPAGVAEVLGFVSRGRGYVGCEPYPDATARRVLAELEDGGWIQ